MSVSNQLKRAIQQCGEPVTHISGSQEFETVGMVTPVSSKTTFSNNAIAFRPGYLHSDYFSYIAAIEEDEAYAVGDIVCTEEKQYTVAHCGIYPFRGENVYVHAFLKEYGEDGAHGES